MRGQKVAEHHKVINSSIHAKTIAQIRMKFVVALALLPLSAAIVGGRAQRPYSVRGPTRKMT